ncbi:hypothetical protein ACGFY7_23635 [Streptomyces prunicolor]|uniref:hypothetical protein n=1 Tax=Streptomyces prunicolor TaxID=67348 RepID=UPI00371129F7
MPYEPWQPGMIMNQARMASISPVWQDWTPVWTTSTGNNTPSFGNAAIIARYAQTALTVHWRLDIIFGSTTAFGGGGASDNWRFSMPVSGGVISQICGHGEASDASVASTMGRLAIRARVTTSTTFEFEVSSGRPDAVAVTSSGVIDAVSPWTWANSDALRAAGTYEVAA